MSQGALDRTVDAWTVQAVVASRFLIRLYRGLGDGKQASNASQAGSQSEERAQRLGLNTDLVGALKRFSEEHPDNTEAEFVAWKLLVEAQAGICAFHSMVSDHSKSSGLQGARNRAAKAFRRALVGFRIAFPEEMTNEQEENAFAAAANKCALACSEEVGGQENHEGRQAIVQEIQASILNALREASGLVT